MSNLPASKRQRRTNVACHACRSRKVRCSKDLPCCSNCRNIEQPCNYPSSTLKPGPKLGSIHKRRRLESQLHSPESSDLETATATTPAVRVPRNDEHHQASHPAPNSPIPTCETLRCSEHLEAVSFLCRVSNESSSPKSAGLPAPSIDGGLSRQGMVLRVCYGLGITLDSMKQMVHTFFATFTSFRLFREPVFWEDLSQTSSELPVRALLTAMIAFSVNHMCGKTLTGYEQFSSSDFMEQAVRDVGAALTECGDDPPPLCLLQALILVTHGLLIRGVRGRAWRHLGLCIRIALELNLYAVDANKDPNACSTDVEQWCKEEEQRRAYWAIWEMDQFANHLKHIPMTVDWTQNYVLLPAEDEKWFRGQPQRSCFLDSDLITRSKTLHATGNKSDRAWYIVMASLNPEAHDLAYPSERIYRASGLGKVVFDNKDGEPSKEWICSILFNAIQLCTILLPPELKFQGQYLEFGTRTFGKGTDSASLHSQSSIYLLAMMPEIARLLALRPYVVEAFARKFLDTTDKDERCKSMREPSTRSQGATREVTQCRNAAEAVLNIAANCHEKHYQYVNPYVASASWLAATTNLLLQELSEDQSEKSMIRAKFEVLKATNDRFIQYWDMSTVPKQNLDTLANKLKQFTAHPENVAKRRDENRSESASAGTRLGFKSPPSVGRPARYTRKDCGRHGGDTHTPSGSRRVSGQAQAAVVVVAAAAASSSALSSLSPRNRTNVGMDAGQTQDKNVALDSSAHMHVQGVAAAMDAVLSPDQVFEPTMHSNLDSDFGLGDRNVSLLSHNPCTRAHGLIAGTGSEQDYATTSHWEAPELEQSHIQGTTNSNPSDWFSFYPDAEFGGDLLEYFDVFSGPFLG